MNDIRHQLFWPNDNFDRSAYWKVEDLKRVEELMQECGLEVVRFWPRTTEGVVLEASFLFTLSLYFGLALKVEEKRAFILSNYNNSKDSPQILLWPISEACQRLVCSDDLGNLVRGEQFVDLSVDTFVRIRRMLL